MSIVVQAQTLLQEVFTEKGTPKWLEVVVSRHLPKVVVIILTLIIASQAADMTWRLIPQPETAVRGAQRSQRAPVTPAKPQQEQAGLEKAADLHLFGVAGVKKVAKIEEKAPETRLNLTLHGVFVDEDPEQGAAIIGTSGATQKYYKVGATVMSGVVLRGVFADRVVLSRSGQQEVLRFPKVPSAGSLAKPVRGASSVSRSSTPERSESLRRYGETFRNEPLKIFEHVRFVPVRSREGLKGYRVLPQRNRELYNQLGIRPSDLVTAVNGVSLNNDQEAMKLIDMLKDASTIQVDIVRNGQPQSLTFSLN